MFYLAQTDIPQILYSENTGEPIKRCVKCERNLMKDTFYIIEKAFRQDLKTKKLEGIFEYALCDECHEKMGKSFSKESLERIKMYFDLYVDMQKRDKELYEKNETIHFEDWIAECIISKKPISELAEFQIAAWCFNDKVIYGGLPMAISFKAADEIQEVLSQQTKDELDDFYNYINPPIAFDQVSHKRLIFI